jgi:hypothetical protein
MKYIVLASLLFLNMQNSFSQNLKADEENIKTCINNMFSAMKTIDTVLLKSCFADNCILQTIVTTKNGNSIKPDALYNFVKSISTQEAYTLDEQIVFEKILTDGILASVYTPYKFYFKGKFNHCGVNSFQLVKLNGDWKIVHLIDTRYKNNCTQ